MSFFLLLRPDFEFSKSRDLYRCVVVFRIDLENISFPYTCHIRLDSFLTKTIWKLKQKKRGIFELAPRYLFSNKKSNNRFFSKIVKLSYIGVLMLICETFSKIGQINSSRKIPIFTALCTMHRIPFQLTFSNRISD